MGNKEQKELIKQIIKKDEETGLYKEDIAISEVLKKYGHLMTKEEIEKMK